jgi:hypothetical protein
MTSPVNAAARWVITGELALESAALLGPVEERRLVRDPDSGAVTLPGDTLSNLLREHLIERLTGFGASGAPAENTAGGTSPADWLFGSDQQRALIVTDAVAKLSDGSKAIPSESRAFSSIEHRRGVSRGRSRPVQSIPAGPVFALRFDLVIAGDAQATASDATGTGKWPEAAVDPSVEASVLAALVAALEGLQPGGVQLGARRSRGFGVVTAGSWRARRFDLGVEPGREAWQAAATAEQPLDPALCPANSDVRRLVEEVAVGGGVSLPLVEEAPKLAVLPDRRRRIVAEMKLRVDGSLLVRTGTSLPAHIRSGDQPILPGAVVAGALRGHAARLLGLVEEDRRQVATELDQIFGTAAAAADGETKAATGAASRIRVSEAQIDASSAMRVSRLPVSRFTGAGNADPSTEQPEIGGRVRVQVELREPTLQEAGLFLLLLKDLMDGQVSIGGGASVGRGVLQGNGVVTFPSDMLEVDDSKGPKEYKLPEGFDVSPTDTWSKLFPGQSPYGPADKLVDQAIRAFASRGRSELSEVEAVMS